MATAERVNGRGISAAVFMPPVLAGELVRRPELERQLGPTAGTRLSLVTGPAGYGKTTLARQWLSTISHPWSWVTVDQAVAAPEVFWPVMVQAIQHCLPDFALDAVDAIGADQLDASALARTLVEDLLGAAPSDGPVIIAVDDAHLLHARCWDDLEWVVSHQPPSLHLVLISRSDPPFSTARLRALGWLTEVRHRDLALRRDDAVELLRRGARGPIDDELADAVFDRTEGWAAGMRLALVALERGTLPEHVLDGHGSDGLISELLIAEALDRQPPDVRQFLQDTSVATVLDPGLAKALTGRDDSRAVLSRLAHDHVFISPIDGARDRYRYHPLFAEVLRVELRSSGGEAERHRRAAAWYEQQGAYAASIEHALHAGDYDAALDLIVRHLGELGALGHRQDLGRWLLRIPDEFVGADPDRAVRHCAGLLYIIRPEWLRAWRRADDVVGDDRPDLRARVELMRAFMSGGQGHLEEFSQHVAIARSMRPDGTDEPFEEVVAAWTARLLLLHGRIDEAVQAAWDAFRMPRTMVRDGPAAGLVATVLTAAADPTGPDRVGDVIAQWREQGEPDISGMADVLAAGSHLALERGDVEEAEMLAAGAVAVSAERPTHLLGALAELALADVEVATGRPQVAHARLDDLFNRLARTGAAPVLLDLIDRARGPALSATPRATPAVVEQLTDRELDILRYLASHRTFPEIGRELYISRHTVKTHVSRIYRKLGVTGRSAAIRAATTLGLL